MPFQRGLVPFLISLAVSTTASSAQDSTFALELNNAQDNGAGGCRITYVARNGSGTGLERTEYEVAIFDTEQVVRRLLVLKFGDFDAEDTKVSQFDITELGCAEIASVVVNRVVACTAAESGAALDLCKSGLETDSITAIRFFD